MKNAFQHFVRFFNLTINATTFPIRIAIVLQLSIFSIKSCTHIYCVTFFSIIIFSFFLFSFHFVSVGAARWLWILNEKLFRNSTPKMANNSKIQNENPNEPQNMKLESTKLGSIPFAKSESRKSVFLYGTSCVWKVYTWSLIQ